MGINCDNFDIINVEIGIYFMRIMIFDKKRKFDFLIVVYGDAQVTGKNAYLAELSRVYQNNSSLPMMIGGDFNVIRKSDEKKTTGNDHWSFIFNAIIEQAGLRELPLGGEKIYLG